MEFHQAIRDQWCFAINAVTLWHRRVSHGMWNVCMERKLYQPLVVNHELPCYSHRGHTQRRAVYLLATVMLVSRIIVSVIIVQHRHWRRRFRIDWIYRKWHHLGNRWIVSWIKNSKMRGRHKYILNFCRRWMQTTTTEFNSTVDKFDASDLIEFRA